ncbi:MAG: metallophosphoesterase family protein, partial [Oscillospiraceae bacterium]
MKYAIISDIHGNSLALRAVLEDGKNKNVDRFLFCGYYFMSEGDPNDAVTQLKNTPNSVIISGNHEGYLRNLENTDPADWVSPQFAPLYQSFRTLTQENRRYLETLPEYADIEDGEIELHMAHKSTVFFGDAEMREYSSLQFLKKYENRPYSREIFLRDIQEYLERDLEFLQTLDTICAGIYIFGHTHVQWHAKIGDTLFINPGA